MNNIARSIQDYRQPAVRLQIGGCDFPVDPDLRAPDAPVFWLPAIAPAAVHLIEEIPVVGIESITLADLMSARRKSADGLTWLQLHDGAVLLGKHEPDCAAPVGILLPLDDDWPIRLAAADRLRRRLIDRTADPPFTQQQLGRLKRALRTVDGRRDGASYRTVATEFFGARRVAEEPWKTSSLKAQVARLAALGHTLIDNGYRRLLRGQLHRADKP
ncbi:MAG: DUF2285 domain-containing protein [Pseudomonadota bacterium]